MKKFVKHFSEITKKDFIECGGKAANLGELTLVGLKVPEGFCVTAASLKYLIEQNSLKPKIDKIVGSFDYEKLNEIDEKTSQIRKMISEAKIPENLYNEISENISALCKSGEVFVAVRSSVSVKDSTVSSFPGMMDTYHYLKGENEIIEHIRKCWASLWTARAVMSRYYKKIEHDCGLIAPVVQKMVHSEVAGVLFTANPITSARDEMVIESNWGLGESVVSGKSMNDFFILSKPDLELRKRTIAHKTMVVCFDDKKGCGRVEKATELDKCELSTLDSSQIQSLGKIGLKIEQHYGFPQDIEWAFKDDDLYILQSRNIRTLKPQ